MSSYIRLLLAFTILSWYRQRMIQHLLNETVSETDIASGTIS